MSVLSLPRVYFRGMISWNPATSNNNPDTYDGVNAKVILPSGQTYKTFKKWMMGTQGGNIQSGWDYYGDHGCNFVPGKTVITGGVLSQGAPASRRDPLVGRPIQILGNTFNAQTKLPPCRLVDVDPASGWSAQIYFDSLAIGEGDASITGPSQFRMHMRWVNSGRNYNKDGKLIIAGKASVVWQTCVSFDDLSIENGAKSGLLANLKKAMMGPTSQGLMIRFCTYRTLYYQNGILNDIPQKPRNGRQLSKLYLNGEVFANPAYSLVVGVVGVWNRGEPATVPSGRYLTPRARMQPKDPDLGPRPFGPAVVEINPKRKQATIDLNSAIPEVDSIGTKANYGPLTLGLIDDTGNFTPLGTIPYSKYNQSAYEKSAGIVDVPLAGSAPSATKLKKGELVLLARHNRRLTVAMREEPLTAQTDQRGVYIDEDSSQTITIRVNERGGPPPMGTQLILAQYDSNLHLIRDPSAPTIMPAFARSENIMEASDERLVEIVGGNIVKVGDDGTATVTLKSRHPGFANIAFLPVGPGGVLPVPPGIMNPMSAFYSSVRVMPFDAELETTPNEKLTWGFVYNNVLRVYDLIFPIMSEVVPLSRRKRVEAAVQQIRAMTAKDFLESSLYMPITRDLSAGKRKILHRWCNLVERGNAP